MNINEKEYKLIDVNDLILIKNNYLTKVCLNGWIKTNRVNKKIGFITFNDGTNFESIQIVYKDDNDNFNEITKLSNGTAICVFGEYISTPEKQQSFEIVVDKIVVLGDCDSSYPLQQKKHSFEFLRDLAYLRPRTNIFHAVNRIRNALFFAIHTYLQKNHFLLVNTPIITSNDAEGAGETFKIVTFNKDKKIDNFFGKLTNLTVSGQLHLEAFALAFKNVYTFGPTFRAEKSHTLTHTSEFWMLEVEVAFADLNKIINLIESLIKFCLDYVLKTCIKEINFLNNKIDQNLCHRLQNNLTNNFIKLDYNDAINLLKDTIKNDQNKFKNNQIEWGMDLKTEHEKYLVEHFNNNPVFIINYPKDIKAFYMRLNNDNKTVACCDLLFPIVGEVVGGSQREERYELLAKKIAQFTNANELSWYLNLRKFGGCQHAGFGIGFDRLLMYITGIQNVRDVQAFPRFPDSIKY